jgi:sporulation protein YlmC with PRC-barrel domain
LSFSRIEKRDAGNIYHTRISSLKERSNMHTSPSVLSTDTIRGDKVRNPTGEDLGTLKELMVDVDRGRIAYAVLSFGGVLGMGDKLFAIPWNALKLDNEDHAFVLHVPKDKLESAPGFDKSQWPDMADRRWATEIHSHYGYAPYWD